MSTADELKDAQQSVNEDLRELVRDTEELLKHKAQDTGAGYKSAREKLEQSLSKAKQEVIRTERAVIERAKIAAKATDHYVHDHPWQSVGVGVGVGMGIGLLLGMLIGRK